MRLRPSRIARDDGRGARALRRASAAIARPTERGRRAMGKSHSGPGIHPALLQRSLVKVSYTPNRGRAWRAHGHYLSREGAQRPGEKGLGFDAERDDVYLPDRLDGWQKAGDPRLWKIVVSPEAGRRTDLRQHVRDVVARMEVDLGTRLEWAAIEHRDTEHPHVHVAIRGIDDHGQALVIDREYVRSGIRTRSQELLTRDLGYRHERDRRLARERAVTAFRLTEIDRSLLARAGWSGEVAVEEPIPKASRQQARRLQDLRRLHFLAKLGLAERVSGSRWRLSPHLETGLRQIQIAGDIQKSLARSQALVTDRDAPIRITRLAPGVELSGRVAGAGLDESRDQPFLILEGTDSVRHLVPQTPEIERARDAGILRPGSVVTLTVPAPPSGTHRARAKIVLHGRLRDIRRTASASTLLDLDALRSIRSTGVLPARAAGRRGFFGQWSDAVRSRAAILEREGLLQGRTGRDGEPVYAVTRGAEQMVESRIAERELTPRSFEDVERLHGKRLVVADLDPGRIHRGELVAYVDEDGHRHAVLETGRELTAVAAERSDIPIGHRVQARARMVADAENREQRRLAWTLDDLDRHRERGHGRGR